MRPLVNTSLHWWIPWPSQGSTELSNPSAWDILPQALTFPPSACVASPTPGHPGTAPLQPSARSLLLHHHPSAFHIVTSISCQLSVWNGEGGRRCLAQVSHLHVLSTSSSSWLQTGGKEVILALVCLPLCFRMALGVEMGVHIWTVGTQSPCPASPPHWNPQG
jgi:hypothetical protein